jgi:hypothetical protein
MKVLVLRTCDADLKSHKGFQWPDHGHVIAPDWDPIPKCGNGLHGFLWGEGYSSLANWSDDAKWLVCEVDSDKIVDSKGKIKFPECDVVFCGSRFDATKYLHEHLPPGFHPAIMGATITTGNGGTSISGNFGISISGICGTSISGYEGQSTSGHYGQSTSGNSGKCRSGESGIIQIKWVDNKSIRNRILTGYIGEDGLEPDVFYRVEDGKFVKCEDQ